MTLYNITKYGLLPILLWGEFDSAGILANYEPPLSKLVLLLIAGGVIAYFLGSLNFAVIISRVKFKDDIRRYGSGNAGMTNMLRTYGKAAAAFTLLGDAAKAAVSVLIGTLLAGESGAYIAGLICVVGHSFPIFYGFKGGKGIVVTATTLLCLEPVVFLILFVIFVLLVASTKFLSLGSIIGMLLYPVLLNSLYPVLHAQFDANGVNQAQLGAIPAIVCILNAVFVVWLHRENIKRLMSGTENKFSLKKKDKFIKGEKEEAAEDK